MNGPTIRIDGQRLLGRIGELAQIGATPEGGVRRLALSEADKAGRDQVVGWMMALGLQVRIDQLGNIFGLRGGQHDHPPVMTGSHIDSVANGGRLDGAYGVLAGLEVVETFNDGALQTERPLIVVAFTNEEGARYQPDMMGSLVHVGGMSLASALATQGTDGTTLGEELHRIGYAGTASCGSVVPAAFVELHIEQGPVLEQEHVCIGAVQDLQGISWTEITIQGQANHAGTTPMALRHDAGYCAARINAAVREIASQAGANQVGTVGVMDIKPDVINVIPGSARMTVDLRNTNDDELCRAEDLLADFLEKIAVSEGVRVQTRRLARFPPVIFDERIVRRIEQTALHLNLSCQVMTSGAGHDAQMMSRICPTAMIFVPSINGISHNPAERTDDSDLVAGCNVLLHTLLGLCDDTSTVVNTPREDAIP